MHSSSHGKICYLEIPSKDVSRSAEFYSNVFGWSVRTRLDGSTAFDDSTGQVSGSWLVGPKAVSGQDLIVSIMVDNAEETLKAITANGGTVVQPIGRDYPEITAHFQDPFGNVFGIYQESKHS